MYVCRLSSVARVCILTAMGSTCSKKAGRPEQYRAGMAPSLTFSAGEGGSGGEGGGQASPSTRALVSKRVTPSTWIQPLQQAYDRDKERASQ
ncbi:hypothetical protein C0Q70_02279 [Pomacea canaliculata]|uniref:Uncharacterized protein n=1 Tax=Pomacea canaliculata TaxID=400727 RepID=A0A2T7PPG3_POMCA|nr:hypothetical protein C0Q70_02279 [Pomacea canaliculata]